MTESAKIEALEAKVEALQKSLESARDWMELMYADMLKLQFSAAKAISGDRDGANKIFLEVQKNADLLREGRGDD